MENLRQHLQDKVHTGTQPESDFHTHRDDVVGRSLRWRATDIQACSKARSSAKISEEILLGVPLCPEPCRGVHSCKPLVVVRGANV